jgi:hypothetical protein
MDSADFKSAIAQQYAKTNNLANGVVVVDRNGSVFYVDQGFEDIFEVDGDRFSSLGNLLPPHIDAAKHLGWIGEKYDEFESAIKEGTAIRASYMSGKGYPRVIKARDSKGTSVAVSIEICPLHVGKDRDLFVAGFISREEQGEPAEAMKAAAEEELADVVGGKYIKSANAWLGVFTRAFMFFRDEVFKGIPGAGILAFIVLSLFGGGIGYLISLHVRGDSNTQIRIEQPPISPDLQPEKR